MGFDRTVRVTIHGRYDDRNNNNYLNNEHRKNNIGKRNNINGRQIDDGLKQKGRVQRRQRLLAVCP